MSSEAQYDLGFDWRTAPRRIFNFFDFVNRHGDRLLNYCSTGLRTSASIDNLTKLENRHFFLSVPIWRARGIDYLLGKERRENAFDSISGCRVAWWE
jgi:hypothetical protein